jgi:AraC-like DNA-binding protein
VTAVAVLFDTMELDSPDRPELWSEAHERIFFPIGVRFANDFPRSFTGDRPRARIDGHDGRIDGHRGRIEGHRFGPLGAYRVTSDPSVVRRTSSAIIASDPEQFLVGLSLQGSFKIDQQDRSTVFRPGEMSSWDSSRPFVVTTTERFDLLLLVVPKPLLGARRDVICRQTARHLDGASVAGTIAVPFFRDVWRGLEGGGEAEVGDDVADAVIALVRGLHASERAEKAPVSGQVLVAQIKTYIDRNLDQVDLDPPSIARAHYISTRYLHKLFAAEGTSVSEWVRRRRLEACWRDLRDASLCSLSISQIALARGFVNAAHFSRAFREQYGCTPSEIR